VMLIGALSVGGRNDWKRSKVIVEAYLSCHEAFLF
jgi:hypothetical protein